MSGTRQIPQFIEELVLSFLKKDFRLAIVKKDCHPSVAKALALMADTT